MNLKTFNPQNIPNRRQMTACIGINIKNGSLRFNREAYLRMKLSNEMQIQFLHDEDDIGQWYLEIVKKDGFKLRKGNIISKNHSLIFQSCSLVKEIFDSVNFIGISGYILIAPEPIQINKKILYPLITAKLLNK